VPTVPSPGKTELSNGYSLPHATPGYRRDAAVTDPGPGEHGLRDFTLTGPVLEGGLVRLEPLDHRHAADLAVAAEEDRSSYAFTWVPTAAEVGDYIDAQLARAAAGKLAPYAQVARASGRAVGATAYWDPRPWPDGGGLCAIEVGFTWLAASAQGTGLNTEAKLLLFGTAALAPRSRAWRHASRAFCETGRDPGHPASMGACGTPRCIRFSRRSGRTAVRGWRHGWQGSRAAPARFLDQARL